MDGELNAEDTALVKEHTKEGRFITRESEEVVQRED